MQDSILEGSYRLASPHSFAELLQHDLGRAINIQMNEKPVNFALLRKLDQLKAELKDEVRIFSPILNSLRNQNWKDFQWSIYERFMNGAEGFETSDGLKASIESARNLRKYLNAYFSAGKAARKKAIFIGVER
jgi:hypothetical protein